MTNLTRRNFLLGSLGIVSVFLIGGLVGCGNNKEAQTLSINLEDYADMPAGELWVVLEDGTVDKFENHTEGYADGVDYFLNAVGDDEVYYTERYEGATYIVHCQVKSTKSDWQTRSGDTFETALELTADEGYLAANGMVPATALTVETDGSTINGQGIKSGDSVIVASTNFDFRYDNLYAPTEVMKVEE